MNKRIYLSPPHMSGNEMKYIKEAFDQNWIAPIGPNVDMFEKELASFLNVKHVAAVSSGTAAIHLALINLNIGHGDLVAVSSLTFSATINPIIYQGATPVFIDSEKETWNMCPELLRNALRDTMQKGKKIKAIIAVHIYGMPANMKEIQNIADEFDIPIIEDAAESLGSKFENTHTGAFGKMGILSFNGNKIITTSGGGALISNEEKYISTARFLSTQAKDNFPYYHHTHIGYNYRMSNVVAGIGRGQLEVLNERIERRREIFTFYKSILSKVEGVDFVEEPTNCFSNRWLSCITVSPERFNGISNHQIMRLLEERNIETRYVWKPMHLQPVFSKYPAYTNGVSEDLFSNGLCLPSGSGMTEEDLHRIQRALMEIVNIKLKL